MVIMDSIAGLFGLSKKSPIEKLKGIITECLETKYWVYFVEEDRDSRSQTCRWEIGKFHSTSSFTSKGEEWTIVFRAQKKNTSESSTEPLLAWESCPKDNQLSYERLAMRLQHQLQVIEHLRKPYENVERSVRCLDVHSWIDEHFYVRKAADWSHLEKPLHERLHDEEEVALVEDKKMFDAQEDKMEHIFSLAKELQSIVNLGKVKYKIINEMGWNQSLYQLEIRYTDDAKKDDLTYCTKRFTTLEGCLIDAIRDLEQDIRQAEQLHQCKGSRWSFPDQEQSHSESVEKLVNSLSTHTDQNTHSQVSTGGSSNERSASVSSSNFASDAETTMMQCMANLHLRGGSSNSNDDYHVRKQQNSTGDYSQHHRPEPIRSTLDHNPIPHSRGRKSASATHHPNPPKSTTLVRRDIPKLSTDPAVPNGRHRLVGAPTEHGNHPLKVPPSGEDGYEADIEPVMYSRGEGPESALTVYRSDAETLHENSDSGFESGVEGAF